MPQPESSLKSVGLATEEVIPDVAANVADVIDQLNAHARLDFANAHGLWKVGTVNLYDQSTDWFDDSHTTTGHKIGDHAALVKINEAQWLIPCGLTLTGPTQVPRDIQIWSYPPNGYSKEDDAPPIQYFCKATGTLPMTFQWEFFWNGGVDGHPIPYWIVLQTSPVKYVRSNQDVEFKGSSIYEYGNELNQNFTLKNPQTTDDLPTPLHGLQTIVATFFAFSEPDEKEFTDYCGKIRCRVSNSAAGGGVRLSPEMQLKFKDETDC